MSVEVPHKPFQQQALESRGNESVTESVCLDHSSCVDIVGLVVVSHIAAHVFVYFNPIVRALWEFLSVAPLCKDSEDGGLDVCQRDDSFCDLLPWRIQYVAELFGIVTE